MTVPQGKVIEYVIRLVGFLGLIKKFCQMQDFLVDTEIKISVV